ncbi:MAG: hypothetical protein ABIV50_02825 [Opitutus sp.]
MNDDRLDDLVDQHLNGTLSHARRRELEIRLLRSEADRQRFWTLAETHILLREHLQRRVISGTGHAFSGTAKSSSSPDGVALTKWPRWLSWTSCAAASIGLAIGIFGASAAWAYVAPALPVFFKQVLALANPSFEQRIPPVPEGIPVRFGVWSGDYAELVGPQNGIVPKQGARMFRFLRSDSLDESSRGPTLHGNIYQVVDIRSMHDALSDGSAMADWSAWFNCVPSVGDGPVKFVASVWAFAGDPSILKRNWTDKLYQEIAYSSWNIVGDDDLNSWQRIAGTMVVPPNANYLVVELKVIPTQPHAIDGAVSFAGHYADAVELSIRTRSRVPTAPSAKSFE